MPACIAADRRCVHPRFRSGSEMTSIRFRMLPTELATTGNSCSPIAALASSMLAVMVRIELATSSWVRAKSPAVFAV